MMGDLLLLALFGILAIVPCWKNLLVVGGASDGSFRVFRNTVNQSQFDVMGGARLMAGAANRTGGGFVQELTMCFRFQLVVLAGIQLNSRGILVYIADWLAEIKWLPLVLQLKISFIQESGPLREDQPEAVPDEGVEGAEPLEHRLSAHPHHLQLVPDAGP